MSACSRCGAPADRDMAELASLLTKPPPLLCTGCLRQTANTQPDPPKVVYKPAPVPFGAREPGADDE